MGESSLFEAAKEAHCCPTHNPLLTHLLPLPCFHLHRYEYHMLTSIITKIDNLEGIVCVETNAIISLMFKNSVSPSPTLKANN